MDLKTLTYLVVGATFALYIFIAIKARAASTAEFYVAGKGVHPVLNGMATGADWMSAASFISMAGLLAFGGYGASAYLMGWTGGYCLLAMLLAPYLRKYGKFTVPEFIGDRFYSNTARVTAVICLIVASLTYVIGQMTGIGVAFSRFLGLSNELGLFIGMGIVFVYAVLGGMKGVTYTQIAQYVVLIFAYTVPAIFISMNLVGSPVPQLGLGMELTEGAAKGTAFLQQLDGMMTDLGFKAYTDTGGSMRNMFLLTLSLMIGTAGLPHVITRFFTVPKVKDARFSAGWALVFIAILYTTAPAVGSMARMNLMTTIQKDGINIEYKERPDWFKRWEVTGLLAWTDHNKDGRIQYAPGGAFSNGVKEDLENPGTLIVDEKKHKSSIKAKPIAYKDERTGASGEVLFINPSDGIVAKGAPFANELYINRDIMVLANPEIANLPDWVIALVAAGGIAAALSTAAGLLLAIASSISHDLLKGVIATGIDDKTELLASRIAMACAIGVAGYLGLNPPGFAAQTVALAFGLAASSLFPALMMGIFFKKVNRAGAVCGMLSGLTATLVYIFWYKGWFFFPGTAMAPDNVKHWLLGINPTSFGVIGAAINFTVALTISSFTAPPPEHIQHLVEDIRVPKGAGASVDH